MSAPVHNPALVPPRRRPGARRAPARPQHDARADGPVVRRRAARSASVGVQFSGHARPAPRAPRDRRSPADARSASTTASQRAAGKGARDAVVFVDGTAFVVSVRNKTVITAVDRDHMRDHVFTNIDSAVIA